MKKSILALVVSALSINAYALDLSTTVTQGTTTTVQNVNSALTGQTTETSFEYLQNRDQTVVNAGGQCPPGACNGNDSLTVSMSMEAVLRQSTLQQNTTGQNTSIATDCDVSVAVGGLTNSQGYTNTARTTNLATTNDNVTDIYSGKIEVSTVTDKPYTGGGSKLGNDFTVNLGGLSQSSEGNSVDTVAWTHALINNRDDLNRMVTVTGQDLNSADMNGLNVKLNAQTLRLIDTGTSVTTGTTTSVTTYEKLN
jgi:hypothetical protein